MLNDHAKQQTAMNTLSIDIGGTSIKMMVLDSKGLPLTNYLHELTPHPATKDSVCLLIEKMIQQLKIPFDRVSAGFPGVVQHGIIMSAANMHASWIGFPFQNELVRITNHPALVANDADIQGLGDVAGNGVELVITLGTGVGSALFLNGHLVPNLELGHHPFQDNLTYESLLGIAGLEKYGIIKWSSDLNKAILLWQQTFNYDQLYLGGGNAHQINFKLPELVKISDNIEGILGGIKLWER